MCEAFSPFWSPGNREILFLQGLWWGVVEGWRRKGSLRQSNLRSRKSDGFRLINDSFTKPSEMYTWPETSPECVLYSLLRTKKAAKIQRTETSIWLLVEL